jgi:hypothetical protein
VEAVGVSISDCAAFLFELLARLGSRDLVRPRKLVDLQVRENIEETALPVSDCCFQFAVPAPEPIALALFRDTLVVIAQLRTILVIGNCPRFLASSGCAISSELLLCPPREFPLLWPPASPW